MGGFRRDNDCYRVCHLKCAYDDHDSRYSFRHAAFQINEVGFIPFQKRDKLIRISDERIYRVSKNLQGGQIPLRGREEYRELIRSSTSV